jgi:hypothetical protein
MPFTPRTPDEIRQSLIAYFVSTGVLTSIDEGDVAGTIFGAFGTEISAIEHRLLDFINGHLLNVSGELLDDRVGQIPNVSPRKGQRASRGGSVTLTKADGYTTLEFPPSSIRICDPDRPGFSYVNRDQISFSETDTVKEDLYFICTSLGATTNAPIGVVTFILVGPGLFSCTNVQPFTGGADREPDEFLRQRAIAMILSLARSQANAIEALALNFTDSTGGTILHAKAIEYADNHRGYTEIVVSDGQGLPAAVRPASPTSGYISELQPGSRQTFWFDGPAVDRITLQLSSPFIGILTSTSPTDWWIPIEEKGVAWTQGQAPSYVAPGVAWSISGHQVYQGWIAEFQDYVNRTCTAAGTRVRVVKPEVQVVTLTANCIVQTGLSFREVHLAVKNFIIEFFNRLAPGQPAFMHKLHDWVAQVPGIVNVIFDQPDLYPATQRTKLVATINSVTLR